MKKIAIIQSNYIPWKGYFDLISASDETIIYDDMQYTRRDWRNRNKIKTPQGLQWLTVPVVSKGKYLQSIRATEINGSQWALSHWKALELNYGRASFFPEISEWLKPLYTNKDHTHISNLNRLFIIEICKYLNINTLITCSWNYKLVDGRTERLADLCVQAGGNEYISGPAARGYIDENIFMDMGIRVSWFEYDGYPAYPQLWGEFFHGVTILDLLFNCGKEATVYMKHIL
jgi:hypothetical protein